MDGNARAALKELADALESLFFEFDQQMNNEDDGPFYEARHNSERALSHLLSAFENNK